METKVNILTDCENELEVTLNYDEIKEDIEKAYKKERKNITMPGFRKGKVPMPMLKKIYGEAIEYKASEKIANDYFWKIVDEQKLEPISTPAITEIDFKINEKLSFKVKYEVKPKLELKDYKGLEIEKPIFKVKDELIKNEMKLLQKSKCEFKDAETVEDEEFRITVDLERLDENGKVIEGSTSKDVVIDLSEEKIAPEIYENAKGKKVGDTFKFSFKDEHMHGEEKHIEEFKYSAKIEKVEKMVLPEATEEMLSVATQGKAKTPEEFENLVRENYESYFSKQSEDIYANTLYSKIVENNDFEPPKNFVENLLERLIEMEKQEAKNKKMTPLPDSEYRKNLEAKALWTAKWQIISTNIVETENIKVGDEDLEKLAEKETEQYGIEKEKLMSYYKSSNRAAQLLDKKVFEFLKEQNPPKEIDAEEQAKKLEKKRKDTAKKEKTKENKPKEDKK